GDHDDAFGGDAGRLLVGLRKPLAAHELGGGIQVALGFDERLLALHHACAGALAELLDCLCCDVHENTLVLSLVRGSATRSATSLATAGPAPRPAGDALRRRHRAGGRRGLRRVLCIEVLFFGAELLGCAGRGLDRRELAPRRGLPAYGRLRTLAAARGLLAR